MIIVHSIGVDISCRNPKRCHRGLLRYRNNVIIYNSRILTCHPFDKDVLSTFQNKFIFSQDRLTHVQLLLTWNFTPPQHSKFSDEYLLLTPRSVPTTAPLKISLITSKQALHPPTYCRLCHLLQQRSFNDSLERHPFLGLIDSAGELLHTPQRISTSMTIVLLSKSSNTLYGIRISEYRSFLTTRLEHPTSPVLLTKSGPLRDLI